MYSRLISMIFSLVLVGEEDHFQLVEGEGLPRSIGMVIILVMTYDKGMIRTKAMKVGGNYIHQQEAVGMNEVIN